MKKFQNDEKEPSLDLKTLLETTPENLAATQHGALKLHILNILRTITRLVEQGEYEQAMGMTFYSPGDEMGSENYCINFRIGPDDPPRDIKETLERLYALKLIAEAPKKTK